MDAPLYAGVWVLVPELSFYEAGEPPASGRYEITVSESTVSFAVAWTDDAGTEHSTGYGGSLGAGPQEVPGAVGVTASFEHVSAAVLDSTTYAGGHAVAYARRQVSADGSLLAVLQVTQHPDAPATRTTQVYRREA